ncbi:hypothetical protein [Aquisphaera insulae]|uniref:hypothetical protein n=1 Tax=Aquisphaera insulae TaxID=2712864 RepID=UPI0013EDBF98|nr:hypothetical protein [Aquisphaera insulae]
MSLVNSSRLRACRGIVLGLVRPSKTKARPAASPRPARRFRPGLPSATPLEPRALLSAAAVAARPAADTQATIIQQKDATIVLPGPLEPGRTYLLVVAFSYNGRPSGTQYTPLTLWKTLGPQEGVIVFASKLYANAVFHGSAANLERVTRAIKASVDAAVAAYPVDPSRIILTGLSGGGNYAEYFNLKYPGYAAAVVDNSGRVPLDKFKRGTLPTAESFGASRRVAILLASPSDAEFYNDAVKGSLPYYKSIGWQVRFYSFPGGHNFAPIRIYKNAIDWMESLPSWQ